jgi:hypothetical protein
MMARRAVLLIFLVVTGLCAVAVASWFSRNANIEKVIEVRAVGTPGAAPTKCPRHFGPFQLNLQERLIVHVIGDDRYSTHTTSWYAPTFEPEGILHALWGRVPD